jgi:hypothetical protein
VQQNPVLAVPFGDRSTNVQLRSQSISMENLAKLWLASSRPLRLTFGIIATLTVSG